MSNKKIFSNAVARLKQDYIRIKSDPVPYIEAEPLPSNMLEWYYVVIGPENTPYEGGYYLGRLVFPGEYPFKPPSIIMMTPNGRFKTCTRLCLSISDFHPDTWNPAWSVSSILTGLLSFMLERSPTLGSIECSDSDKRIMAINSLNYNLGINCFIDLFPELTEKIRTEIEKRNEKEATDRRIVESSVNTEVQNRNISDGPDIVRNLEQNRLHSAITNICLILGFAIFAYTVKYVILNIS